MNYKLFSILSVLVFSFSTISATAKVTPAKCNVDIKKLKKQGKLKGMNIKERQTLARIVGDAESNLNFFKQKFDISVVFDCASMVNIMKESERNEKPSRIPSLITMTSNIKTLLETAGRNYTQEFDEAVKTIVVKAEPGLGTKGIKAELKNGVLTISRSSFRYGGYTTMEWKKWLEEVL